MEDKRPEEIIEEFVKRNVLDIINRKIDVKVEVDTFDFVDNEYYKVIFQGCCLGEKYCFQQTIDYDRFNREPKFKTYFAIESASRLLRYIMENNIN